MVRYFIPHQKVREKLLEGSPSSLRELEEAINRGTLVELRCPMCGALHLAELRFLSPFAPCPQCSSRPSPARATGEETGTGAEAEGGVGLKVTLLFASQQHHPLSQLCLGAACRGLSGRGEVLVATDGRSLWDPAVPDGLPLRVLETPGEPHFLTALNQALLEGRGEYLAVVREGVLVQPGWLKPLISALEEDPEAAAASALLLDRGGRVLHAGYRLATSPEGEPFLVPLRRGERPGVARDLEEVPALALHCSVVRRSLAREIGLADERSFLPPGSYGEVEWLLKARAAGRCLLLVHTSRAMYLGQDPKGSSPEPGCESLRNLRLLLERWSALEGSRAMTRT
ncbi:MAG: hypothetical protein WHT46_07500 [Candidatus Geothermincolales bacterium]